MTRFITPLCLALTLFLAANAGAQVGKSVTIADANVIAEADLAKLPHMNAAIAKAVVGKRPFLSMTALDMFLQGQGLNRMQLNELYGRLFLHVDLNTATDAEIQHVVPEASRFSRVGSQLGIFYKRQLSQSAHVLPSGSGIGHVFALDTAGALPKGLHPTLSCMLDIVSYCP